MKNLSIGLNIVLFIGLGVLYYLHFSNNDASNNAANSEVSGEQTGQLKVAYVNIDSILLKYNLSLELNDAISKRQANMKAKLDKESADFQQDAQVFQDKVQRGIFLTQQRAEQAQQELLAKQQELQQLEYDYSNQLATEQQKMNIQLFDSITSFINSFNSPEKYQVILGHQLGGNLLYGSEKLDITNEIVNGLNKRYPKKD